MNSFPQKVLCKLCVRGRDRRQAWAHGVSQGREDAGWDVAVCMGEAFAGQPARQELKRGRLLQPTPHSLLASNWGCTLAPFVRDYR